MAEGGHDTMEAVCELQNFNLLSNFGSSRNTLRTKDFVSISNFGKRLSIGIAVNAGRLCNKASVPISAVCRENLQSKTDTYFSFFHRSDESLDPLEMKPVSCSVKRTND
jgi:hypothetical protein